MAALSQRKDPRDRRTSNKEYLPARPLADALMRIAARSDLASVCERADIPERILMRWRRGEGSGVVEFDHADRVLTRLGLLWWDVWNEDTVRESLFEVATYRMVRKREKCSHYRMRRIKERTIPYGDLGTNYYRLREITALMTGALEEAA